MKRILFLVASLVASACRSAPATPPADGAVPTRALAGLLGIRVVVTPTYALRVAPNLGWGTSVGGRSRDILRRLDADIVAALDDRGVRRGWVFPEQLVQSYSLNPTYAPDPYALAEEPLRSAAYVPGTRLPDPLASQVRTLVALHDARLVLAPIEIRFEKAGAGARAALRVVLLDARTSEVQWVGEVYSDSATAYGPAMTASLAAHFADLVAAP